MPNSDELELLLREDESSYLDFKSQQYPFEGATNREKGELLKDIIAFANAWRRSDAYILIGVREVVGGRSEPIGVSQHLDDAKLQQFVRSKVKRPITFSYEAQEIDGASIGILSIPVQDRPVFLTRDYGALKANAVYVRRGSSTDVAAPDEIAEMGGVFEMERRSPNVAVQFAETPDRTELGSQLDFVSTVIKAIPIERITDAPGPRYPGHAVNTDFVRELFTWFRTTSPLFAVGFQATNDSPTPATNVQMEFTLPARDELLVFDDEDIPPRPHWDIVRSASMIGAFADRVYDVTAKRHGESWEVKVLFGNIRPRGTVWSRNLLHLGALQTLELEIPARIYADNLPQPELLTLGVSISARRRDLRDEDLERYVQEEID